MSDVTDLTGKLGPWHYLLLLYIFISQFFFAINNVSSAFNMPNIDHWCKKPDNLTNVTENDWKSQVIPHTGQASEDHCSTYKLEIDYDNQSVIVLSRDETSPCAYGMEYDHSNFKSTVVEEFNVVCDNQWMSPFAQSMTMAGVMIGSLFFGHLADHSGRKFALYAGAVFFLASVLMATFANSFWFYVASRGLQSLFISSQYMAEVMFVEAVFSPLRFLCGIAHGFGSSSGEITIAAISIIVPSWRISQGLMLILSVVTFVFFFILPESPRWLLTKKKFDRAYESLKKIAFFDRIDEETLKKVFPSVRERYQNLVISSERSFFDLFRARKIAVYSLCMFFHAFVSGLLLYAATMSSTSLGGTPQIDAILVSSVQLVSNIFSFIVLRYVPRRIAFMMLPGLIAICYYILAIFWRGVYGVNLAMTFVIKVSSHYFFLTGNLYTDEVYPTPIRAVAYTSFEFMYRLGATVEPFIRTVLLREHKMAPPLFYGSLGVIGVIVTFFFLPETLNRKLRDSSNEETVDETKETERV